MAYDSYNMASVTLVSGTLAMTLYVDSSVGDLTGTVPAKSILSLEDIVEKIEDRSGYIEIPSGRIKIQDTYSETYPHGFWYTLCTTCADNSYGMPEVKFTLDTGGGAEYLFWGRFDVLATDFTELYIGASQRIRTVEIDILSSVTRIKDLSLQDLVTELKTNRAQTENPTGTPSGLTVTFAGTPGATVYKYRVAARDANGEYTWSSEATVSDSVPVLNGSGDHNHLSFTGVALATDYAIYRTYVGGGSLTTGFIGVKGSGGSGTITFDDTGFSVVGSVSATQTQLCARMISSVMDIVRVALQLSFDQGYSAGSVTYDNEDIRLKQGVDVLALEQVNVLVWKNFNTFDPHSAAEENIPEMDYAEYFNDGSVSSDRSGAYFGNTFPDTLSAIGHICKHFAAYPRYFYDTDASLHSIELLARGRQSTETTPDGDVLTPSFQTVDCNLSPKCIHAYRSSGKDEAYPISGADVAYDLDFGMSYVVMEIELLASQTYEGQTGYFYGMDYQQLYSFASDAGKITFSRIDGVEYYDYASTSYVAASSRVLKDFNGVAYLKAYLQEAFVLFFRTMTNRYRKMFRRSYGDLTSTKSAVSSQMNSKPCAKIIINDGISSKNFYVNEVRKSISTNKLELTLVQM